MAGLNLQGLFLDVTTIVPTSINNYIIYATPLGLYSVGPSGFLLHFVTSDGSLLTNNLTVSSISGVAGNIVTHDANGKLLDSGMAIPTSATFVADYDSRYVNTNGDTVYGFLNLTSGVSSVRGVGTLSEAFGFNALVSNSSGIYNTAVGSSALTANVSGFTNVAIGRNSLLNNLGGNSNLAVGAYALRYGTYPNNNVAVGNGALDYCNKSSNIAIGVDCAKLGTQLTKNVLIGETCGYNVNSEGNVGIGHGCLSAMLSGGNVSVGYQSLFYNITGSNNVALGYEALSYNLGSYNVAIGYQAGKNETGSNKLYIANSAGTSADALIYGEFDTGLLLTKGKTIPKISTIVPLTSGSAGNFGELAIDNSFLYVCIATNTWKRTPLSDW